MAWIEGQYIKDGKYEIKKKLGSGGYGTVYLASDRNSRNVAIKTLHDHLKDDDNYEKFEQDFMNEARRLAKFTHLPFIVKIYEVIKEGDIWGIVMEYIDGENLEHLGIISQELALRYIQQVSSALSDIHKNNLLHRDIKPQNILVRSETKEAILVDFGIAREFTSKIIQTQTPLCTPFYASPEQHNPKAVRAASSDIYSLSATLYKILTGIEPESAISRCMYGYTLKHPKQINPQISDAVEKAILKGLELDACNRPQTVEDWLALMQLKLITIDEYEISQNKLPSLNLKISEYAIAEEQEKHRIARRVEFYITELSAPEYQSRYRAIQELETFEEKASPAVPYLIQIMEDIDDALSSHVGSVLSKIGVASVIPLSHLLQHENVEIRRQASMALESIGVKAIDAIDSLIMSLEDEDAKVRWYSTITLGKIGIEAKRATHKLISKLNDQKEGIRAFAAYALGRIKSEEAIVPLLEKVKDENEYQEVFVACLEALRAIGFDMKEIGFTGDTEIKSVDELIEFYRDNWLKQESERKAKHTGVTIYFMPPLHASTPPQ